MSNLITFPSIFGFITLYKNDNAFINVFTKGKYWEYSLIMKLINYIPEIGTILDIGGHCGTHCIAYANLFPKTNIITFEPQSKIREILDVNIRQNNITNIIVNPNACGHKPCTLRLAFDFSSDGYDKTITVNYNSEIGMNFGGIGLTNDPRGEEVNVITIDSLNLNDVVFIKIDVEGAEKMAVFGARETIKRCKPVLLVEESDKDVCMQFSELNNFNTETFLRSVGYTREDLGESNYLYTLSILTQKG
jgi:FkbM family methyltransferase